MTGGHFKMRRIVISLENTRNYKQEILKHIFHMNSNCSHHISKPWAKHLFIHQL